MAILREGHGGGSKQARLLSRMQIKEAAETFVETMKSEGKSKGKDDSKPTAKAALGGHEENILLAIDPEGNMIFAFDPDAPAEDIATTMAEHITHYGRQNACEHLLERPARLLSHMGFSMTAPGAEAAETLCAAVSGHDKACFWLALGLLFC